MELIEYQMFLDEVWKISVIAYWVVFGFGIIGNILVLSVILIFSKMKTVTNIYIFNLALVDILSLSTIPIFVRNQWTFGPTICKVYTTAMTIFDFSGSFLVAALSADRYLAICRPHTANACRTKAGATLVNILVWVMSAVFAMPLFVFADTKHNKEGGTTCKVYWPDVDIINGTKVQFIYLFTFGFLIPFAFIVTFYFLILCKIRNLDSPKSRTRRRRVTFLVLTLITVFMICWLPYWVNHIILAFVDAPISLPIAIFSLVAAWLSFTNSAINPLIYGFTNKNFQDHFLKLFKCGEECKDQPLNRTQSAGFSYYGSGKTEPSHSFVFKPVSDLEPNEPSVVTQISELDLPKDFEGKSFENK
ncbi:Somatostatin receptor type 1-like protein [Dinothrombium tinctorium]|uniref:Somatostatin receptor type 1-like protein n=1 Tax=Dinothrombium tinctorium TaxID=1965070 RepID=A0A443QFF9_9ACAR|nr:Somatostatin receptor type 1-like protein [Dinothrombium tinctorium]RWS01758.1 Somatostatin receptor type 1-like protein [Dinothrombium tinctorium]